MYIARRFPVSAFSLLGPYAHRDSRFASIDPINIVTTLITQSIYIKTTLCSTATDHSNLNPHTTLDHTYLPNGDPKPRPNPPDPSHLSVHHPTFLYDCPVQTGPHGNTTCGNRPWARHMFNKDTDPQEEARRIRTAIIAGDITMAEPRLEALLHRVLTLQSCKFHWPLVEHAVQLELRRLV
jgi:hypothetical protein